MAYRQPSSGAAPRRSSVTVVGGGAGADGGGAAGSGVGGVGGGGGGIPFQTTCSCDCGGRMVMGLYKPGKHNDQR
jgi:hypothetical protein